MTKDLPMTAPVTDQKGCEVYMGVGGNLEQI
jgi:hypothetical protein